MAAESTLTIPVFLKTTTIGPIAWTPSKKKAIKRQNFLCCETLQIMVEESGQLLKTLLLPEDEPACEVAGNVPTNLHSATEETNEQRRERCRKVRVVKTEPADVDGNAYSL
ncbi:uncharacterized protein RSE6_09937 [Rhynchosporium secalis]|uniref:Uncharacterized protein n=1 Tax=Rhynchosporium secalis TaxID=38038 RepID=A0A1E1MJ76_RHYSE|nr:uncharacterized protein RSE6_09937 [Rhynchosporium secalis]